MATSNASIVGAFLASTNDFKQFTPAESQAAIDQMAYHPYDPMNQQMFNDFQDFLVNRIGQVIVNGCEYKNQLAAFKNQTQTYGSTIENIMLGFAKVNSYGHKDDEVESLLKRYVLKGKVQFLSVDRKDQIPITINADELRMSFTEENGINNYINNQIAMAVTTDEYTEYNYMKNLPGRQDKYLPLFRWPKYSGVPNTEDLAKTFLTDLRTIAMNCTLPSYGSMYSPAHMPTTIPAGEGVLLCNSNVIANMDVKALAAAFNVDYAKSPFQIIFVDDFGIDGCFAALTSRKGIIANDTKYKTTSFHNPQTDEITNYLNHWEILGLNLGAPWILFGTGDSWTATSPVTFTQAATGLTISPATTTAAAGDVVQIKASLNGTMTSSVSGTETPEGIDIAPDAALYSIAVVTSSSTATPVALNSRTYVNIHTGELHIQKSGLATGNVITVTCTSIEDSTLTGKCVVTIS